MKVLHFIDCDSLSWIAAYIEHIQVLAGMGADPVLLCRPGEVARIARESGIPVVTWRPLVPAAPWLSPGFVHLVRGIGPHVIHTRLSSAARIAGTWRGALGIPIVATFDKPAKAKYYRHIDRYISCADWLKRYMAGQGLPNEKIDVIHNSVNLPRYARNEATRARTRAELGIAEDEILFSGMGIYIRRKGFDVLIRAFAKLCAERGKAGLRLALIGGGGEAGMREEYRRLAGELGVADRLLMPQDFLSDVRPWLWASDVFVMPSREEGFSIALLEGLASGLPVVVSDIEPFTEIIGDGENGLVAAKDNAKDFARSMGLMLDRGPGGRAALVQNALSLLERDFTPLAAAKRTLGIYERLRSKCQIQ